MAPFHREDAPILPLFIALVLVIVAGLDTERIGDEGSELFGEIPRDEVIERINQLAEISDADGYLERTFLSPASMRAAELIIKWMQDAGLRTWVDQMGNIHGRIESVNKSERTLLIGSHFDTVVDAGKFDGSLGIISAISALKALKISGKSLKLKRPVEVIAFSDEEGVRFQSTFLGSAAIAGQLPAPMLNTSDKNGVTIQDVLKENSFEGSVGSLLQVKYDPESVWGYVEVHIEQGPVLESLGYPLGIVQGIAGQTRLKVKVTGSQGHAGTVPMLMRQDPMTAAAELIVNLESLCKYPDRVFTYNEQCGYYSRESFSGLVCTVGEISAWPSASNVIPSQASYNLQLQLTHFKVLGLICQEKSMGKLIRCGSKGVDSQGNHRHIANGYGTFPKLASQHGPGNVRAISRIEARERQSESSTPTLRPSKWKLMLGVDVAASAPPSSDPKYLCAPPRYLGQYHIYPRPGSSHALEGGGGRGVIIGKHIRIWV
ncbi:hypothetical protein ZIOFF_064976 [Zingiber officinale]|uniref:Peptidase M20 dimerisation domain-containing protein n=1 Tax=Zingiber officinale TaxID=94328 RepID=A0A8J5EWQ7_ZINOF|nr:hypothetical protein ZIOFF_064976 [Zingiber officinale]